MKNRFRFFVAFLSFAALACLTTSAFAQVRPPLPRASQKASVMQTVGATEMSITYSRPAIKGRTIWGDPPAGTPAGEATLDDGRGRPAGSPIVFWGKLWRTGANEATLFHVTDDVLINGSPLPAGKYSFHTIPGKDEWTIVFNKDDGQWGSFAYDAKKDALRIKAKPQWVADSKELLYFGFDNVTENAATVYLRWEKVKVPFTVEVRDVVGATISRLQGYVAAARSDDPVPAFNAANYAKANKQTEAAAMWYYIALKASDEQVKANPSFANMSRKANILLAAGKREEAIAAGEKAVEKGKADKADTTAFERRLADIKAGKL